jgi:hypothetical protein
MIYLSISPRRDYLLDSCRFQNLSSVVCSSLYVVDVAIMPRSAKHAEIFREEWEEAKRTGVQFERTHLERLVPQ